MRLRPGNRKVSNLKNFEPFSQVQAYQYALKLLTGRDYTVVQLCRKLRAKECSEPDTEAALSRLIAEGWLNDRRYAERFAESALANGRFFGPRLRLEMRRRGVPPELITEVVERMQDAHDEGNELRSLLDRRFSGFDFTAATDREKRRVITFLQRRGFSSAAIRDALRE
jgi:regulatory protein